MLTTTTPSTLVFYLTKTNHGLRLPRGGALHAITDGVVEIRPAQCSTPEERKLIKRPIEHVYDTRVDAERACMQLNVDDAREDFKKAYDKLCEVTDCHRKHFGEPNGPALPLMLVGEEGSLEVVPESQDPAFLAWAKNDADNDERRMRAQLAGRTSDTKIVGTEADPPLDYASVFASASLVEAIEAAPPGPPHPRILHHTEVERVFYFREDIARVLAEKLDQARVGLGRAVNLLRKTEEELKRSTQALSAILDQKQIRSSDMKGQVTR